MTMCRFYRIVTSGRHRQGKPATAIQRCGAGVMIGAGAKILGNIEIGDSARHRRRICVVLHAVPAHTTVAGVPAKIVGVSHRGELASRSGPMCGRVASVGNADDLGGYASDGRMGGPTACTHNRSAAMRAAGFANLDIAKIFAQRRSSRRAALWMAVAVSCRVSRPTSHSVKRHIVIEGRPPSRRRQSGGVIGNTPLPMRAPRVNMVWNTSETGFAR